MKSISYSTICKDEKVEEIILGRYSSPKTESEKRCRKEIDDYLAGKRKNFSFSTVQGGTDFQKKVWREIMKIPYGKTLSYKEIAQNLGNSKAYRAVANACGANKLPIIIPCHRVVSSNGLGGYSGGIAIKKILLNLESCSFPK
jgi:methylated-DNA-[protein]-cysteine S-methyltransferase